MSSLEFHQQLRKGLDSITNLSKAINSTTLELVTIQENKKKSKEEWEGYQRLIHDGIQELSEIQSQIKISETLKARITNDLEKLNDAIRKLTSLKDVIINKSTTSNNTAIALRDLRDQRKKEVKEYEKLKAKVLESYKVAVEDLSEIRSEIDQESRNLKTLQDVSKNIKMTQDEREAYLNEKDAQLSQKDKKLKKYEERLINYAEKLNINL